MTTTYSEDIPTGWSAAEVDAIMAGIIAEADAEWDKYVQARIPNQLRALSVEYLATVDAPDTDPTHAVIAHGASVTLNNSAGASVGPATAAVVDGVLTCSLPATKAVVADGAEIVVNDNAGTPNAKSPGVAEVALGVVTDVKLAA